MKTKTKPTYAELLELQRRDAEFWDVTIAWWTGCALGAFSGWLATLAWFLLK